MDFLGIKKKLGKVFFNKGVAYFLNRKGRKQSVETLNQAMELQAECHCGGISCCYGYISLIDVTTREPIIIFVEDGTLVTMPSDEGIPYVKAKKEAFDTGGEKPKEK